jgi:hypothetical protein
MFKTVSAILAVALLAAAGGCRREDVREFTLGLPGLNESNKTLVVEALSKYNGIDKSSYVWDMQGKRLTLRYDSMQIAKENIRQAIEAKKVKVER